MTPFGRSGVFSIEPIAAINASSTNPEHSDLSGSAVVSAPTKTERRAEQRPLRILFISSCVLGGGAGWSFYYLLKHLDRELIDPLVVVPAAGIFEGAFNALGLRVKSAPLLHHRTNEQRFRRSTSLTRLASSALNVWDQLRFIPQLASLLNRERIDLIYCNNMMVKTVGALAAQLAGVPAVLHVRNLHERPAKALLYGMLARLPVVKQVIANSAASAVPYRRHTGKDLAVVHNGVDLEEYSSQSVPRGAFRREVGIEATTQIVGFTGWLIPRKGLDILIRAAALLLPSRPNLIFVAVGGVPIGSPDDYRDRYEQLAHELGIQDRFRFAGFREDVRSAVADFDMLVLPSRQEPFGRSIIEAMALGTAVVASNVGGIPEIVRDQENGLLVPPGDVKRLAAAIASLIDNPQRRETLAAQALLDVQERFDVARLSRQIQDLLVRCAVA